MLASLLSSCCEQREWYVKEIAEGRKPELGLQLLRGRGYYYQGSVPEQFQLVESMKMDSTNGDLWREIATAPLKRGIADVFFNYYEEGVKRKPLKWSGFRGYIYLYFYRDYQRALADFDYNDQLIGEVGFSQGQSHDYMRGLCYYGLKDYENSLVFLDKYINETTTEEGEEWVDVYAFLYRGLTKVRLERFDEALEDFDTALKYYPNLSDCFYHKARILAYGKEFEKALELLEKARSNFQKGYYHQRPYVEVPEQVYIQDIEVLEKEIKAKLFQLS